MVIQCRKCETRFRFDDSLIKGDGVWVRCSRCQHVFFQPRSNGKISATGEDIPSVRVSDARRSPEDQFPAGGERPAGGESRSETALSPPVPREREREADSDREPSIDGLGNGLGKETFASDPEVGDEVQIEGAFKENSAALSFDRADEPDAVEEEIPAGERKRGWGRTFLKWTMAILFAAVVAGSVYLYIFPENRIQLFSQAAPWLRGVPFLENFVPAETKSAEKAMEPVHIKDVRQRSVANLLSGNLRVVEGVAVNQSPYPLSAIRVRLVTTDAYGVVLQEKTVYCGNLLTDAELGALTEAEIERELSIPQGSDVPNERVMPNGEIPFMIVTGQEKEGAVKTMVTPGEAEQVR